MKEKPQFEQICEESDAKQRAILWPDTLKAGGSVDSFLWNGDSKAKPIQRAGLIVFGVQFGVMGIVSFALCLMKPDLGWIIRFFCFLVGLTFVLVSKRLFRNAFLRQKEPHKH